MMLIVELSISCHNDVEQERNLPADPGLRHPISDYHPNVQDDVRRAYLQKIHVNLVVMSFHKHFKILKKREEKIDAHVGGPNNLHNEALSKCEALLNQRQHLRTIVEKQTKQAQSDYRVHLFASIEIGCLLSKQGLAFHGHHHESTDSYNRVFFLEVLKFLSDRNKDIGRVTLYNSPENVKLTSPDTQRDIVCACAIETSKVIVQELGDSLFFILVDEAQDIALKEQMVVVIRFLDKLKIRKLLHLVEFSSVETDLLDNQLESYIIDMRSHQEFLNLSGMTDLATHMSLSSPPPPPPPPNLISGSCTHNDFGPHVQCPVVVVAAVTISCFCDGGIYRRRVSAMRFSTTDVCYHRKSSTTVQQPLMLF
ncbi:zinc finger MYM-type protein 1-like protein [Canna indica]|uniref:Zinc finger MYM-type protein 1-like protein n=1 Tax=Canna indica TaxID=4628 RepID=A0AAQ3Q2G8_9LILI|nr:zinc finger MYM-type protein 1-like protein [Canna indica]